MGVGEEGAAAGILTPPPLPPSEPLLGSRRVHLKVYFSVTLLITSFHFVYALSFILGLTLFSLALLLFLMHWQFHTEIFIMHFGHFLLLPLPF